MLETKALQVSSVDQQQRKKSHLNTLEVHGSIPTSKKLNAAGMVKHLHWFCGVVGIMAALHAEGPLVETQSDWLGLRVTDRRTCLSHVILLNPSGYSGECWFWPV